MNEHETYRRDVVPRPVTSVAPVVQPAQYYDAQQVQQLLANMARRGDQPIIIQTPAPDRAGHLARDVDWGQVIKWLAIGIAAIIIIAMLLVTCSAQPQEAPPPEVHKPNCVVFC